MTAVIRSEQRNGKTVYVVYPGFLPPVAFEFIDAAKIHCAVEGYDWMVTQ